jgi:hypothetical protein
MSKKSVRPAMLQHPGRVPGCDDGSERMTALDDRGHQFSRAPSMAQPRTAYDAQQIARASYFTAVLFLGRGRYDRRTAATLSEIRDAAKTMSDEFGRRAMIYAVSPEGLTIPVS